MIFEGIFRRFSPLKAGTGPIDGRVTHCESIAVAQVEAPKFEMSRAGRRFLLGNNAAITGIAPVQVLPTVQPQWAIGNNDPARAYVLEQIGVYLTAGTPGVGGSLVGCLFQTPNLLAIPGTTGASITSASSGGLTSKAVAKSSPAAITIPAAPNWFPLASNFSANVTAFASSVFLENRTIDGAIIIPPLWALGLAVVAPAGTTPLFAPFAMWHEVETDLE